MQNTANFEYVNPHVDDSPEWYPRERRTHPSLEEVLSLQAHRMDHCARKIEEQQSQIMKLVEVNEKRTPVYDELARILPHLIQVVDNRKAISAGQRFLIWVAAGLASIFAIAAGAQQFFDYLHRVSGK